MTTPDTQQDTGPTIARLEAALAIEKQLSATARSDAALWHSRANYWRDQFLVALARADWLAQQLEEAHGRHEKAKEQATSDFGGAD